VDCPGGKAFSRSRHEPRLPSILSTPGSYGHLRRDILFAGAESMAQGSNSSGQRVVGGMRSSESLQIRIPATSMGDYLLVAQPPTSPAIHIPTSPRPSQAFHLMKHSSRGLKPATGFKSWKKTNGPFNSRQSVYTRSRSAARRYIQGKYSATHYSSWSLRPSSLGDRKFGSSWPVSRKGYKPFNEHIPR